MTDHLATGMKRMIRTVARSASLSDRLGEQSRLLRLTGNRSTLDFRPAEHGASSWDFEMSVTPTEPKPYGNAETREPVWRETVDSATYGESRARVAHAVETFRIYDNTGILPETEKSYDDVRPDDGAMRLANRIIEYNAATETIEALRNPDAVYDELASILQPVLSSMDGTYFAGSEWFAGEVDRMEADRINGEQPEETDGLASEEPRIPFIVESEATAADTDEPPLDELITAATHEYLDSGMTYDGFSEHVRTTWRNAAAYDWSKLMAEPRSTGEWSSDANRLAALGVMMQFAPESTCMMIASDMLAENAPLSLPALRERINTPDGMVNTDLLFSRLIDNGTTPDPARIDMAMGILGPLEANAPTDACYRIIGLKAMLSLAMGDGEKARELAEQAIGYDASDRFASSVLDRLPETDPAMEAANVWENGGHLGR